jgi:hypothetical protein
MDNGTDTSRLHVLVLTLASAAIMLIAYTILGA